MIRVTQLFKTYFPDTQGGLEEAIRQIGKYSVKNNIDMKVVTISEKPQIKFLDGIKIESYKKDIEFLSNPLSISLSMNYRQIIKETDILHLHFPWPSGELLTLLSNIKKPIVITYHCDIHKNSLLKFFYSPFINLILKRADVIIPTSQNLLDSTPNLNKFKEKCEVINLWLDSDRFTGNLKVADKFKQEVEGFHSFALFIGVLRWYKGIQILIESAKKINGNIVIVGKGPLLKKFRRRIEKEKISNVFFIGYQDDDNVKYLLKKCLFTILPSISPAEAFGQVLLESSYYRKPMISTELGTGTSYVNKNGITGIVVRPNDSNELTVAINELFINKEKREIYGKNAYDRYISHFTEEVQGHKYLNIYKRLSTIHL